MEGEAEATIESCGAETEGKNEIRKIRCANKKAKKKIRND
jgi:hypothetical protein